MTPVRSGWWSHEWLASSSRVEITRTPVLLLLLLLLLSSSAAAAAAAAAAFFFFFFFFFFFVGVLRQLASIVLHYCHLLSHFDLLYTPVLWLDSWEMVCCDVVCHVTVVWRDLQTTRSPFKGGMKRKLRPSFFLYCDVYPSETIGS